MVTKSDLLNTNTRKLNKNMMKENIIGYAFLLPALIIIGLFMFLPSMMSLYYSLTDYHILTPQLTEFIGLENFRRMFNDRLMRQSIMNIFQFVIFIMPIQVGTALGLALLVNRRSRSTLFYKVAFFSPVVMSLVVVSVLWLYLLNPHLD
jgi:fructooligosaccharide transport system permease protein